MIGTCESLSFNQSKVSPLFKDFTSNQTNPPLGRLEGRQCTGFPWQRGFSRCAAVQIVPSHATCRGENPDPPLVSTGRTTRSFDCVLNKNKGRFWRLSVSKKHIRIISMEDQVFLKIMKGVGILHHFSNSILHQPFMTGLAEVYRGIT